MNIAMQDKIEMAQSFSISIELLDILCGELIGEGHTRIVFDCPILPGHVVKIAKKAGCFDNIMEFEMWSSIASQPDVNKWFVRCAWISANGRVLIQQKATPINDKNKKLIPEKVPPYFTDMKHSNYGFVGKQFVCVDYAFSGNICMSAASNCGRWKKFKSHLNEK